MTDRKRIYLDNAATSWPKPASVYDAVDRYQRQVGAPAGRSSYREAVESANLVAAARRGVAQLLGAGDPAQIVFTANGTDALNIAIHGSLKAGGHVVTTQAEHNSVLRPLGELEAAGVIRVTRVPCDSAGRVAAEAIASALRCDTQLIAVTHASNVTGAIQPIQEIATACRSHGALIMVDAAQTAGQIPIDVGALEIDMLAAPGHKGLLGPLGTGVLYIRAGIEQQIQCCRQGGTGTQSEVDRQPATMPEKYEAGNLNVAGIAGLAAGMEYLRAEGVRAVHERELRLIGSLIDGLNEIGGVTVYGPRSHADRAGLVSFTLEGYDPHELAATLDAAHYVQMRAGLHCAPLVHQAIGTAGSGGTVRASVGPFTTDEQIETALDAIAEIAASVISR